VIDRVRSENKVLKSENKELKEKEKALTEGTVDYKRKIKALKNVIKEISANK
jgi:hypothetical protein